MKQHYDILVTHARFGPWIVGIFVGYFLYHVKKSETRPEGDKVGFNSACSDNNNKSPEI